MSNESTPPPAPTDGSAGNRELSNRARLYFDAQAALASGALISRTHFAALLDINHRMLDRLRASGCIPEPDGPLMFTIRDGKKVPGRLVRWRNATVRLHLEGKKRKGAA